MQTAASHPSALLLSGYARLYEQLTGARKHTAMQLQARVCNANRWATSRTGRRQISVL